MWTTRTERGKTTTTASKIIIDYFKSMNLSKNVYQLAIIHACAIWCLLKLDRRWGLQLFESEIRLTIAGQYF